MSGVDNLRGLTGGIYDPTARMSKALRLGVLESNREWLRAALAENPDASGAELLERAIDEAVAAKRDLDHYDAIDPDRHSLPSRNSR